jgi:site-specific recombinase XerD
VNKGATLIEIGDLLGHRSLSATEIYTKIDLSNLRLVAQPWPGGIQ